MQEKNPVASSMSQTISTHEQLVGLRKLFRISVPPSFHLRCFLRRLGCVFRRARLLSGVTALASMRVSVLRELAWIRR